MTDRELLNAAREASKNAYVPYSKFHVGAALGSTICAERTALVKAISEGCRDFARIAVWGEGQDYCYPCGACRQVLVEFAPDMEVLVGRMDGKYVSYRLRELLPGIFNF